MKNNATRQKVLPAGRWNKIQARAMDFCYNQHRKSSGLIDEPSAGVVGSALDYRFSQPDLTEEILANSGDKNVDAGANVPHLARMQVHSESLSKTDAPEVEFVAKKIAAGQANRVTVKSMITKGDQETVEHLFSNFTPIRPDRKHKKRYLYMLKQKVLEESHEASPLLRNQRTRTGSVFTLSSPVPHW